MNVYVYSVAPLQARGPGVGDAVGIGVGEIVGLGEGATVGLAVGLAAGVGRGVGALAGTGSGAVTVGLLLSFEQPVADINRNVARSVIAQPETGLSSSRPLSCRIPARPQFRVAVASACNFG